MQLQLGMPYFALSSCLCHATATLEQDWHCHCQACVLLPRAEPEPDHFFVSRIQLFFELARLSLTLKNESMANDCLSDLKKIETKVSDWVVATGWGVAQRTQRTQRPQGLMKKKRVGGKGSHPQHVPPTRVYWPCPLV